MASAGGPWRIRVSGSLVYRKPTVGLWSLKIDVDPATGDPFTVILDPDHQAPMDVEERLRAEIQRRHGHAPPRLAPPRVEKENDARLKSKA